MKGTTHTQALLILCFAAKTAINKRIYFTGSLSEAKQSRDVFIKAAMAYFRHQMDGLGSREPPSHSQFS